MERLRESRRRRYPRRRGAVDLQRSRRKHTAMHIRTFQLSDLPALVDLTIEVFGPFYEQSFRALVPPDVYEHQHGHWADDYRDSVPKLHAPERGKHVAVAECDDGQLAAYVGWHIDLERRHGQIAPLAVRETHRRSGLGRTLCEHAIGAMRDHALEVVSV